MIAVDTNVLLRAIMDDDDVQSPQARAFLEARTPKDQAYVNTVVLAELIWTLRTWYELPKPEMIEILRGLLASEVYEIQSRSAVIRALDDFEKGIGQVTDRLIAEINHTEQNCATATFDRKAARIAPFILVE